MRLVVLVLTLVVSGQAQAEPKAAGKPTTREIMRSIFDPLSHVLPYSFDQDTFSAEKNRAAIKAELAKLTQNIGNLEQHASSQDRGFEFVAKSLARDVRSLDRWYGKGRYDEARFTLHNLTENCIACHSSFPEGQKVPDTASFFAKVETAKLQPLERAHLQIVSRSFDDALTTYETVFKSKDLDPAIVTLLGSFSDYLKVSISVKSDFKRPQPVIEQLIARPTTLPHVRVQLQRWLFDLKELDSRNVFQTVDVPAAKKIIDEARSQMEFPRDRDGLVRYLTAEAMLTRFIRGRTVRDAQSAEAYYLLGITTALSEHSFWITRSDFYLESAIRLAPAARFAPKAYTLLEESLTYANSGSGGTHMPDDVKQLLAELRFLIEREHGKI